MIVDVCDQNCFECPYPDCIVDGLLPSDMERNDQLDETAYRNRRQAYYSTHKEQVAATARVYYQSNSERIKEHCRAYRDANAAQLSETQACIRPARLNAGYSQRKLASLIGVSNTTISLWESGRLPANWDKLCAVLPSLKKKAGGAI